MSYEVSVVANYHKGEAFPFQLLIFLFTHNYLNTRRNTPANVERPSMTVDIR